MATGKLSQKQNPAVLHGHLAGRHHPQRGLLQPGPGAHSNSCPGRPTTGAKTDGLATVTAGSAALGPPRMGLWREAWIRSPLPTPTTLSPSLPGT